MQCKYWMFSFDATLQMVGLFLKQKCPQLHDATAENHEKHNFRTAHPMGCLIDVLFVAVDIIVKVIDCHPFRELRQSQLVRTHF